MLNGQKLQGPLAALEVHKLLKEEKKEQEWVELVHVTIDNAQISIRPQDNISEGNQSRKVFFLLINYS